MFYLLLVYLYFTTERDTHHVKVMISNQISKYESFFFVFNEYCRVIFLFFFRKRAY